MRLRSLIVGVIIIGVSISAATEAETNRCFELREYKKDGPSNLFRLRNQYNYLRFKNTHPDEIQLPTLKRKVNLSDAERARNERRKRALDEKLKGYGPELLHMLFNKLKEVGEACEEEKHIVLVGVPLARMIISGEIEPSSSINAVSLLEADARITGRSYRYLQEGPPSNGLEEYILGLMFELGYMVEKNVGQALHYYRAGYKKQNAMAGYQLARLEFQNGNKDKSLEIMLQIYDRLYIRSSFDARDLYIDLRTFVPKVLMPSGLDLRSSNNDIARVLAAMAFNHAANFARGDGVAQNMDKASAFYKMAATLGGGMQKAQLATGLIGKNDPQLWKDDNIITQESYADWIKYNFDQASRCTKETLARKPPFKYDLELCKFASRELDAWLPLVQQIKEKKERIVLRHSTEGSGATALIMGIIGLAILSGDSSAEVDAAFRPEDNSVEEALAIGWVSIP